MSSTASKSNVVVFGAFEIDLDGLDFNDRSSRIALLRITNIIFIVLMILTVSLRIFARAKFVHRVFTDDFLIISATIFTVGLAATCIAGTTQGMGTHIWLLPTLGVIEAVRNCVLYLYICQILYACAIALTKIAIISSYLRFIQAKTFRLTMYAISVVIVGLWATGVFMTIFQCRPVSGAWDITLPSRKCIDYITYLYVSSAINVLTDILLCVLPWPHLWRLNLPRKERIIICVLLAGGASACIVGIVRIAWLHTLYDTDITYKTAPCLILSVGECSLGIISVSISALRPLVQRLFPSMRSQTTSSHRRSWHVRLSSIPPPRSKPTLSSTDKQITSSSQEDLTRTLA